METPEALILPTVGRIVLYALSEAERGLQPFNGADALPAIVTQSLSASGLLNLAVFMPFGGTEARMSVRHSSDPLRSAGAGVWGWPAPVAPVYATAAAAVTFSQPAPLAVPTWPGHVEGGEVPGAPAIAVSRTPGEGPHSAPPAVQVTAEDSSAEA